MKNRSIVLPLILTLLIIALSGCSTGGMFSSSNITDVQLQRNNFRIIARGVSGEATAGYILGGSFSMGMATNTFALVRVYGTGLLYKEALEDLWKNYETTYGPAEGKKLALINVRYDAEALNLIVYTRPKISIRADIIEFTE